MIRQGLGVVAVNHMKGKDIDEVEEIKERDWKTQVQTTGGPLRVVLAWKYVKGFALDCSGRLRDLWSGPRVPVPLAHRALRATGKHACPTATCSERSSDHGLRFLNKST